MNKLFFSLLFLSVSSANAQYYRNSESYIGLTFTAGAHPSFFQQGGTTSVLFSYQEKDLATQVQQEKQASFSKDYSRESYQLELGLLGLEGNWQKLYAEVKSGIITGNQGGSLYGAIGGGFRKNFPGNKFSIRIGASVFYTGIRNTIGHIDNAHKELDIFGVHYDDQIEKRASSSFYLIPSKYDATDIRVSQNYNCIGLKPKIGFEFPLGDSKSHCLRLNIGYNIVLTDFTRLRLTQQDHDISGVFKSYKATDSRIHYHFTGPAGSPYGFKGFFVNLEFVFKSGNI